MLVQQPEKRPGGLVRLRMAALVLRERRCAASEYLTSLGLRELQAAANLAQGEVDAPAGRSDQQQMDQGQIVNHALSLHGNHFI